MKKKRKMGKKKRNLEQRRQIAFILSIHFDGLVVVTWNIVSEASSWL